MSRKSRYTEYAKSMNKVVVAKNAKMDGKPKSVINRLREMKEQTKKGVK